MRKLLLAAVFAVSAGCSGDTIDGLMGEYEGLKKEMCACKDAACADKVDEKRRTWEKGAKEKMGKKEPSKSQMEKIEKMEDELRECRRKAKGEGE